MKNIVLAINIIACLIFALVLTLSTSLIVFKFYDLDLGDAWTFSGSVFGGLATLATAYVAARLVVNWKDQTKYNEQLALMSAIVTEARALYSHLNKLRHDKSLGVYMFKSSEYILDNNLADEDLPKYISELRNQFPSPEFQHILSARKLLLDLQFNLRLYANDDAALNNITNSIRIIESSLEVYVIQLRLVYEDQSVIDNRMSDDSIQEWLKKVFNLSYGASEIFKFKFPDRVPKKLEVSYSLLDSEIETLHCDILEYRKSLDDK